MELVVTPRHPAAAIVGSSSPTHVASARAGSTDHIHNCTDAGHDPANHADHNPDDCAACLIATGRAIDITRDHITPSGHLIG